MEAEPPGPATGRGGEAGTRPAAFRGWPRPARVLVLTSPLFAPAALAGAYAVAYQDALGLGAPQIGLLGAAGTALGFLFLLAGAWCAERWGRVAAMSAFDVLGYALPFALLAAVRTPGELVAATLLASTAQGANAAYSALLMADLAPEQRPRVLAVEHLLLALPGAALPLAAAGLVARLGMVPAVRWLYLVAALSVALMVALRILALRRRGPAMLPPRSALRDGVRAMRDARLAPVLLASGLLALGGALGLLTQVRIVRALGLDAFWLGPFAAAMTAGDLAATAAVTRRAVRGRALGMAGLGLAAAGAALFALAREPALLLASAAVLGIAGPLAGLGTGALLHDAVPEALRDRAATAQLAARALGGLAGSAAAGALYALDPALPWWASAAVLGGAMLALGPARFMPARVEPGA